MALWLIVVLVAVALIVLGVAVEAVKILLWIGVILLVISLVGWLASRARSRS